MLTLIMALSLIGCGSKGPEILGVYDATLDLKDAFVESIDNEMMVDISFGEYVEKFELVLVTEFNEDGTYKQYVDMEKFEVTCEKLKDETKVYLEDVLVEMLKQEYTALNPSLELNTKEDVEAYMGMTMDQMANLALGMNLSDFADALIDESFGTDMFAEEVLSEGNYKAEDGKLYMSESLDTAIDEEVYEVYTIKGDVVTITEGVNMEQDDLIVYPFELIKRAN